MTTPRRPPSPLTLADLTADLIWPRLLRVGHLALRPSRLGLSLVFIIGMMLLLALANKLDNDPKNNQLGLFAQQIGIDFAAIRSSPGDNSTPAGERAGKQLFDAFVGVPVLLIRSHPWVAFVAVPLLAFWISLFGGAISRSAACDFARGVSIEWPQAVGFAISRWLSLLMSLMLPLLIVWAIALALAIGGWALFSLPGINLVGALLWPLFLFGGLIASVVIIAYAFGAPMLIPSIACEGTDAVDAVQHAYSFVFARPLRLIVYLAILIVQLAILSAIVASVFWLAIFFAQKCASAWSGVHGSEVLSNLPLPNTPPQSSGLEGLPWAVHALLGLWTLIPATLPIAFIVSYLWSGSTVLYLAMRRVVDGQDMSEIWMPGIVAGTMAAATPAPPPAAPAPMPESVTDNGPADET